jgi:hypothetical protein
MIVFSYNTYKETRIFDLVLRNWLFFVYRQGSRKMYLSYGHMYDCRYGWSISTFTEVVYQPGHMAKARPGAPIARREMSWRGVQSCLWWEEISGCLPEP